MNLNTITTALAKAKTAKVVAKASFFVRRNSPVILTTTGIVGVVAAGVFASKATLQLEEIVDHTKDRLDEVNEKPQHMTAEQYSSVDHKKELAGVYFKSAGEIARLYAPAVLLGTVSIGCIVGGHGVLHKRNVATVAAYKGLEETFNHYRQRVAKELGVDKEQEVRYGIREDIVKDEQGKDVKVKSLDTKIESIDIYFFDEQNRNWSNSPDFNKTFLLAQQKFANDMLNIKGYVILNDVLESLGFEKTRAGAVTGWVSHDISEDGDGYIDFGVLDFQSMHSRVFGTEDVDCLALNFNIDGVILDYLPAK